MNSETTCHWCDMTVDEPVYYLTKLVNDYCLPVSFCNECVSLLLEYDPKAVEDVD